MSYVNLIAAGGAIIGGAMSSNASGDASDAQTAATEAQIAETRRQYDLTRADHMPWMQSGTAGNQRLAYLLGLSNSPGGVVDEAALRKKLLPKFTKTVKGTAETVDAQGNPVAGTQTRKVVDEAGLKAAIRAEAGKAPKGIDPGDAGDLLREFTTKDLKADPVYQSGLRFGLQEGEDAINARAIASGGYDSGRTLKALTKFSNDYGSTKAGESYNRFNVNQNNIYNRLAGISGTGQTATNQVSTAGTNAANNVAGYLGDAGNSRAAAIVGGSNAWNDAFSGVSNAFNNSRYRKLSGGGSSSSNWYNTYDPDNYMMGN